VGRLPDWIPGTSAALLRNGRQVTEKQDDYVTTAATAPRLRKQLIKKSKQHNPFLASNWQGTTFDDIDWKSVRSSFGHLTKGRQFQLSKHAHNWTPTLQTPAVLPPQSLDRFSKLLIEGSINLSLALSSCFFLQTSNELASFHGIH
jgi:hypothetical protein